MESKLTLPEVFQLLGRSLLLLQNKTLTVVETDFHDESEVKQRVSLVDYIVRAVGDLLLEEYGMTEESLRKALDESKMDFGDIVYPKESKGIAIYNDIH